jgi:hypothetical protein
MKSAPVERGGVRSRSTEESYDFLLSLTELLFTLIVERGEDPASRATLDANVSVGTNETILFPSTERAGKLYLNEVRNADSRRIDVTDESPNENHHASLKQQKGPREAWHLIPKVVKLRHPPRYGRMHVAHALFHAP